MPQAPRLTTEQEARVYRLSQEGLKDQEISDQLRAEGVEVSRRTVGNVRLRVEQRAMAAPPIPAQDPETGIQVELSDDAVLAAAIRLLNRRLHNANNLEDEVSICHVLPKLTTARQRAVRPPGPTPKPPERPQPENPEPDDELVRFN